MIHNLFHYILLILVILVFIYDVNKYKNNYNKIYNCFYIFLSLLAAFRYGMGIDTPNYMVAFDDIPKLQNLQLYHFALYRFNPLYLITNSFCKSIYDDFVTLQILQVSLYFVSLYLLLKKLNLRKFYLLLFFYLVTYFTDGFSAMRESFALAFCQFGYVLYLDKKKKISFLLILIGCLYHSAAVLGFLIFLSTLFKSGKSKAFFRFIFVFAIIFIFILSFKGFFEISFLTDNSVDRYLGGKGQTSANYLNIVKNVFILFFCFISLKQNKDIDYRLYYLGLLYVVLDIISATSLEIAYRLSSYLLVFYLYDIVIVLQYIKTQKIILVSLFVCSLFFYQPFSRYIDVFKYSYGIDAYEDYCSIFSSDKSHYKRIINSSTAADYILY